MKKNMGQKEIVNKLWLSCAKLSSAKAKLTAQPQLTVKLN